MTIVHFLLFLSSAEFWMLCVTTTTKEVETKANVCSSVFSLQHCECLVVFWYFKFFCEFWEPSVTKTTTSPKEWNRASAKPNLGSVDSLSPRCSCALQHSVNFHWKHCSSGLSLNPQINEINRLFRSDTQHVEERARDTAGCIATSKMPPKTRNSASSASSSSSSSSSDSSSSSSRYLGEHWTRVLTFHRFQRIGQLFRFWLFPAQ